MMEALGRAGPHAVGDADMRDLTGAQAQRKTGLIWAIFNTESRRGPE
jgi:hypothetical protein